MQDSCEFGAAVIIGIARGRLDEEGALTMEFTPCEEGCSRETPICEAEQDLYARKGLEYLKDCLSSI